MTNEMSSIGGTMEIGRLRIENESLRQQNAELVRALAFVRDDLNSELDHETRLIIESILAKVQS